MAKRAHRSQPNRKPPTGGRGRPPKATVGDSGRGLRGRLLLVTGPATTRQIGEATGTSPANVRRYLLGGTLNLRFLESFCEAYNVSADWLLEGIGQQNRG